MIEAPVIMKVLSASVRISHKAGAIIRKVMSSGDLGIVDKGINDLQTLADRKTQAFIINSLQSNFPGLCIIGEETLHESEYKGKSAEDVEIDFEPSILTMKCPEEFRNTGLNELVVWVDPLDGTSEYTEGLVEHVTVLIGLSVGGQSVGGVIHQPYSPANHNEGRSVYALRGLGCFGVERRFTQNANPPDKHLNVLTTTRGHGTSLVNEALEACSPTEILRVGGCGHKVLLLLEGRCHAYIFASAGCKKWDTCAPEAILREAGGHLTDITGSCLNYAKDVEHGNKLGVLATTKKEWHQYYLNRIPQSIKDYLLSKL